MMTQASSGPSRASICLAHVGCEAVDRTVRRTEAVHAARLDDRDRLIGTERVGEEAVLEGIPPAAGECEQRRPAAAVVQHHDG